MKKYFLFFIVFSLLFLSCDFKTLASPEWDSSANEFFKEYTSTAAIEDFKLSVDSYEDSYGKLCIASDSECDVTFYLRNPQQYDLVTSTEFFDSEMEDENLINLSSLKIKQTEKDFITLNFPSAFLKQADLSLKDISQKISIKEKNTGRVFKDFDFLLHCNSKPPEIAGAVVVQTEETPSRWVLCFELPSVELMKSIHKDILKIKIDGKDYKIINTNGLVEFEDSFSKLYTETNKPSSVALASNAITGLSFVNTGGQSAYFFTGDEADEKKRVYTLEFCDSAGLTSSTAVSAQGYKLSSVNIYDGKSDVPFVYGAVEKNEVSQDEDGRGSIYLKAEAKTEKIIYTDSSGIEQTIDEKKYDDSDAFIIYEVYSDSAFSKIVSKGTIKGLSGKIILPPGIFYVRAFVRKPFYADSSLLTWKCHVVRSSVFVSESGDDEEGDGSLSKPVKSLSKAAELFDDASSENNTVYLLSNLNQSECQTLNLSNLCLTVKGSDNLKNEVKRTVDLSLYDGAALIIENASKISFKNLQWTKMNNSRATAKGSNANAVYGFYFEGLSESITFENCDFTDNKLTSSSLSALICSDIKELNFINCNFENNNAEEILKTDSSLINENTALNIKDSVFEGNTILNSGAALNIKTGIVEFDNVKIKNNTAYLSKDKATLSASALRLSDYKTFDIKDSVIEKNTSVVEELTLNNTLSILGNAFYADSSVTSSLLNISGLEIKNNSVDLRKLSNADQNVILKGAALYKNKGDFTAEDFIISSNTVLYSGNSAPLIYGKGIYLDGKESDVFKLKSIQTSSDNDIYLSSNDLNTDVKKAITITPDFTGSALLTSSVYADDIALLKSENSLDYITFEICNKFKISQAESSSDKYALVPSFDNTKAVLKRPGIISESSTEKVSFDLQKSSYTLTEIKKGTAKVSWSVTSDGEVISDSATAFSDIEEACIYLKSNGTLIEGYSVSKSDGKTPVLTLPAWLMPASYTITLEVKIGFTSYSDDFDILVTED